jgi:hypothetical protein
MRCGAHAHSGTIAQGNGCGFKFCWTCMKSSESGNHSSCKAWTPDEKTRLADAEMQAFQNTSARYDGNMHGRKMALDLLPRIRETMMLLTVVTSLSMPKVMHLEDAIHEIAEGRRILAWSYVWQHEHAKIKTPQARLFLDNQKTLHKQLEALQALVEGADGEESVSSRISRMDKDHVTGVDMAELTDNSLRIRELTRAVHTFREAVVTDVQVFSSVMDAAALARSDSAQ